MTLDPKALEALAKKLRTKRMRVHDLSGAGWEDDDDCIAAANFISAYLAALPQAEPVAWRWRVSYRDDWCWSATKPEFSPLDRERRIVFDVEPLFASRTPTVSREVTEEMVERAIQAADPDFYAAAKESGPLTYHRAADSMRRALTAALSQPHSEK